MKKFILSLAAVSFLAACATDPYTGESKVSNTAWGTGIGAVAGAGIGALVGGEKGALVGAGIGAVGGAATGGYMDIQARKLRQELVGTGVQVKEVNGQVYLIMPGNITFDSNESIVKSSFKPVLDSIAKVLVEYDNTLDEKFSFHLNNDLDFPNAIKEFVEQNKSISSLIKQKNYIDLTKVIEYQVNELQILGIEYKNPLELEHELISKWKDALEQKNYPESDRIRNELISKGII